MVILRIPRSDEASFFVLLNITPTSPDSPTLNGKIQGTDGSSAFVLVLKPALAARARAAKAACSEDEWTSILKSVLLEGLVPVDVEITATVDDEKEIQVVLRKTFQGGLKQRLGSLTLKGDADEEIELFLWCAKLAARAAAQAKELQREHQELRKLVKETQDLVKAKEQAEKEVIGKCMRLVNSKKKKIQELQSRLSHYEKGDLPVDEPMQMKEAAEEELPQPAKRGRGKAAAKGTSKEKEPAKTTLPRRGKRAAPEPEPEDEDDEPAKDEDVDMDQDEGDVETEGETEGEGTPSNHGVEDEVPEVNTRGDSQGQTQTQRESQKKVSPAEKDENEGPHVTTRAASHSQHQLKSTDKGDGSETESDDEL